MEMIQWMGFQLVHLWGRVRQGDMECQLNVVRPPGVQQVQGICGYGSHRPSDYS